MFELGLKQRCIGRRTVTHWQGAQRAYILIAFPVLNKILILKTFGFFAIHHYTVIFAVEIYVSMTTYGCVSDCGMV